MLFWTVLLLYGAQMVGSQVNGTSGTPENITVHLLDAKTVQVFWTSAWSNVERFDVTYNPTEDKIVSQAAGNSKSIVLRELRPDTQYQVIVTAVVGGKNYKSRRIVFRTSPDPNAKNLPPTQAPQGATSTSADYVTVDPTAKYMPQTSSTVRGVELGLVLLALVVWIVAIALFFHRWGKIRMLLPYQPDYKTQQALKVPGSTMGAGCASNANAQGQQDGPGCIQHLRWSSSCYEDGSTAKRGKWVRVDSPVTVPPRSSSHFAPSSNDCEHRDTLQVVTHIYPKRIPSAESIAMRQWNQTKRTGDHGSDGKMVNVQTRGQDTAEDAVGAEMECGPYSKLTESGIKREKRRQNKYLNSLENVSDSIQSLLGCTSVYNLCQSKRGRDGGGVARKSYEKDGSRSELEPLFFVGEKELYYNKEEMKSDAEIVVHKLPQMKKPDETDIPQEILPTEPKPKRYSRSSLKKQKVSLFDERAFDLHIRVPTIEVVEATTRESKPASTTASQSTEEERPKGATAEMKRKAFLRKISLQDTYVNYNQDYWLDYKKSVRFHNSIDLGCFDDEDGKWRKPDTPVKKPMLSGVISEKSIEGEDALVEERTSRQSSVPSAKDGSRDNERYRTSSNNSESSESNGKSVVMADFRRTEAHPPVRNLFILPSNENLLLFCERNGHIETDFDVLRDESEDECFFVRNAQMRGIEWNGSEGESATDPDAEVCRLNRKYDLSQFYEIKLNGDSVEEPVRRSTVFNFQGGQAFFGENRNSTSGESDVYFSENERTGQGFSG